MTSDRNFKRIVRERMAQTGESYSQARAQLRPRADSIRRYAIDGESTREALARAAKDDLPIIANVKHDEARRVSYSEAVRMLDERVMVMFSVMLNGREVSL